MGRMALLLDPPGYFRCQEPGFHATICGDKLYEHWVPNKDGSGKLNDVRIYNPPGSEWILPLPLQLRGDWYKDVTLGDYVLRQADWSWASGITPVEFEWGTKKADGTGFSDNKGFAIPKVPDPVTSLDNVSYSAMWTAAGLGSSPAGFATIGSCQQAPNGELLSEAPYTPHLEWGVFPAPDESLVFGFGPFALILSGSRVFLLKHGADKTTWTLLGKADAAATRTATLQPFNVAGTSPGLLTAFNPRLAFRKLTVIPVGGDTFYLHFGEGDPIPIKVPGGTTLSTEEMGGALGPQGGQMFDFGAWWLGAAPGQKVYLQPQVVGYDFGTIPTLIDLPYLVDLTPEYRPTIAPFQGLYYWTNAREAGDITIGVDGDGFATVTNTWSNEEISWGLTDEVGDVWESDGTHHQAGLYVQLKADNPSGDGAAYLAPQIRAYQLRFPVLLAARESDMLLLLDTHYREVTAESVLGEADGKRIVADLWDRGVELLSASGHDRRDSYPVHWSEDADNDGIYETVRAAGWLLDPTLEEHAIRSRDAEPPIRFYRLEIGGVLEQANEGWFYVPQLTDPESAGQVEHTFAIRETMTQSGVNTLSSARIYIQPDPYAGTALAQLPGTLGQVTGTPGQRFSSKTFGPQLGEEKRAYCARIARDFRAWHFYERLDGQINYHVDLFQCLYTGRAAQYPLGSGSRGTIYRDKDEALAGCGQREQVFRPAAQARLTQRPHNVVRVTGKDEDGRISPGVIDADRRGWLGPVTYRNFIGQPRIKDLTGNVLAIGKEFLKRFARYALIRLRHRGRGWAITIPTLAPWQLVLSGGRCDVGYVLTIAGRGTYRIERCQVRQRSRYLFETTLTLEELPAGDDLLPPPSVPPLSP